ncbi:winged helix-turn-helix domain-containing protein [Demequina sp.]|uniref:winged helix-turn-helix domain-containing protein n=1 Tax=Demequina sp. TaxID=2050685 RepID=UPI003D0B29A5
MTQTLSAAEARRVFLAAQGMASKRPAGRVRDRQFAQYLNRQGVLQLDSVNVFARAHHMPVFSRYGPYDITALDSFLWGPSEGHGAHGFEHWGHEAAVMPLSLLPAMLPRMKRPSEWATSTRERLERERPGLIDAVLAAVNERGPVVASDIDHLAPREGPKGTWWDYSHVKSALEYLFFRGDIAGSRRANFVRTYDSLERAWGEHALAAPPLTLTEGRQLFFDHAISAVGVGTPRDIADHFRLLSPKSLTAAGLGPFAESAVERGLASWAEVEGWGEPALLAAGAEPPARATAQALLSPFDPVCWFRPRLERMFSVDYRIEIYTPAPKRIWGYYCLLFLMGDDIVARVDLKSDRKAGALIVASAWREPTTALGARRKPDAAIAQALAAELSLAAAWQDLTDVVVAGPGDLALHLAAALQ